MRAIYVIFLWGVFLFSSSSAVAQEEQPEVYVQGKKYLDINIRAKEKCSERISHQQQKLLKKLKKKEKRYAARLKRKDSAAYVRYQKQPYTYDSLSKLQTNDSATIFKRAATRSNRTIDSLKGIKKFCEDKAHVTGEGKGNGLEAYDDRLAKLKNEQAKQNSINELIQQRTNALKNLSGNSKTKVKGLTGIQKQVFYSKGKMTAFTQISDEPHKAEEKALEFLQGQEGFEDYLKGDNGMQGLAGKSPQQLNSMGIQTRAMVENQLKERFGNNLSGLGNNMNSQIKQFDKHTKSIQKAKSTVRSAKQTRRSISKYRNLQKPAFKINPMRSLPLSKRIEKQFNYQTTRPTPAGAPAIFHLSGMLGFKHTPSLTYGAGIATATGLGQSWSTVKFTFEGIGLRTFAEWKWQYGFGAYAGYERMYKQAAFTSKQETTPTPNLSPHNTRTYNESILIGITKTYRINDKWNGGIQVLYDVWWKDNLLKSPIQIRLTTNKN